MADLTCGPNGSTAGDMIARINANTAAAGGGGGGSTMEVTAGTSIAERREVGITEDGLAFARDHQPLPNGVYSNEYDGNPNEQSGNHNIPLTPPAAGDPNGHIAVIDAEKHSNGYRITMFIRRYGSLVVLGTLDIASVGKNKKGLFDIKGTGKMLVHVMVSATDTEIYSLEYDTGVGTLGTLSLLDTITSPHGGLTGGLTRITDTSFVGYDGENNGGYYYIKYDGTSYSKNRAITGTLSLNISNIGSFDSSNNIFTSVSGEYFITMSVDDANATITYKHRQRIPTISGSSNVRTIYATYSNNGVLYVLANENSANSTHSFVIKSYNIDSASGQLSENAGMFIFTDPADEPAAVSYFTRLGNRIYFHYVLHAISHTQACSIELEETSKGSIFDLREHKYGIKIEGNYSNDRFVFSGGYMFLHTKEIDKMTLYSLPIGASIEVETGYTTEHIDIGTMGKVGYIGAGEKGIKKITRVDAVTKDTDYAIPGCNLAKTYVVHGSVQVGAHLMNYYYASGSPSTYERTEITIIEEY